MSDSKELPKEDFYGGLIKAMDEGIATGVGNFFSNIWVGAGRVQEDFLGFDDYDYSRVTQNIDDDLRFAKVVINISKNKETLYQIVSPTIEDTMSQLSYQQQEKIFESIMKASTRFTIGVIITGNITAVAIGRISDVLIKRLIITGFWKMVTRHVMRGTFAIIPMEALLARASDESRMLKYQRPKLYNKLYPIGGDMLYFIFKPVVQYINEY